ncbi:aminotransferase class I/II-fold pyridoxal phosphate-dependent enzyme [Streptomyces sp. HUAS TT20]|uniref:aminotransferase class I/II-fold pyridoxal phosphate-dependent enzyme n=1 Tax=Streptomyces sp. HUAS TT20 TaxID=3447509 RepID=UPI0021DA1036|nr:aminotransferase class I/II-fold pyridoxal phosphate-dependent enzyme [Streptomyces sp. HUAS 15-9]UXY31780.1 aminotransferase class I/II-fold pyridoxal phosphate-dependent enzyme [Streptomyces sp. HUAS 15-9]
MAVRGAGGTTSARHGTARVPDDVLAAEERAWASNREALSRAGLRQGTSGAAGLPDTATKILDRTWVAPLAVGPFAAPTRLQDEIAVVEAAGAAGLPAVVSAYGARELPDVTAAVGPAPWLRLPGVDDREAALGLARRAPAAGFGALLATPDHLGLPALVAVREAAGLPLLAAGIGTAVDVVRALDAGAEGVLAASLHTLPEIAATVAGRCPVLLDGGIRRGADVLVALAHGADAVLLGHLAVAELLADGPEGLPRALDRLVAELTEAMAFTGTGTVADVRPEVVAGLGTVVAAHFAHPAPAAAGPQPPPVLRKTDLHASVSDPVLDTMNFLNEVTFRYPDAISFAPGRPYDGFFATEQIFTHVRGYLDHLAEQGASEQDIRTAMYQYGPTAGRIREILADSLRVDEGIDVPAESLVVTVGAQEAMLLVLRALMARPEDVLLHASPCYVGITGAARLLDVPVRGVEERADGVHCADVEAAIHDERARGRRPRAFYVVPDHSNPSGTTLSLESRTELLELADRHGILILEDSPYRLVSPGPPLPTLKSLDRACRVVHLGSFSKTVFPGARVGFVVADQRVVDDSGRTGLLADELAKIKSMVTVNTSSLGQAVVAGTLLAARGRVSELNSGPAAYYGGSMRATLEQLDRRLPAARRETLGVRWNRPTGGFFLRVEVPFEADDAALTRSAEGFGVIWTPMRNFHPHGGGHRALRLSTSYLTPEEIEEGIGRLVRFIEAEAEAS